MKSKTKNKTSASSKNVCHFTRKMKIFMVIIAVILIGGFGAFLAYFVIKSPTDNFTYAVCVPSFIIFSLVAILGLLEAFRGYVKFDDEKGLEVFKGYGKVKRIPISALDCYSLVREMLIVFYKSYDGNKTDLKRVSISSYYDNRTQLVKWISSFCKDAVTANDDFSDDVTKEKNIAKIADKTSAVSKKYKVVATIANSLGILVAVFVFFGVYFKQITVASIIVCSIYPILIFILIKIAKGNLRFNFFSSSTVPNLYNAVIFPIVALVLSGYSKYDFVLSQARFWLATLIFTAILFAVYAVCCTSEIKPRKDSTKNYAIFLLLLVMIFAFWGYGTVLNVNCVFEKRPAEIIDAKVTERYYNKKKTHFYLCITPKNDDSVTKEKRVKVTKDVYDDFPLWANVNLELHKGALFVPWYSFSKTD